MVCLSVSVFVLPFDYSSSKFFSKPLTRNLFRSIQIILNLMILSSSGECLYLLRLSFYWFPFVLYIFMWQSCKSIDRHMISSRKNDFVKGIFFRSCNLLIELLLIWHRYYWATYTIADNSFYISDFIGLYMYECFEWIAWILYYNAIYRNTTKYLVIRSITIKIAILPAQKTKCHTIITYFTIFVCLFFLIFSSSCLLFHVFIQTPVILPLNRLSSLFLN